MGTKKSVEICILLDDKLVCTGHLKKRSSKPENFLFLLDFFAAGGAAEMKSRAVTVSVALLVLCCLLIPKGGRSAEGIVSLLHPQKEAQTEDELRDGSLDEPEGQQELAEDLLKGSIRLRRDSEGAAQTGKLKK